MRDHAAQRQLDRALLAEASLPNASPERALALIQEGASPLARDSMGFDALMRVCARGASAKASAEMARALIPLSDLSAVDQRGWCASAIAARSATLGALMELVAVEAPLPLDMESRHPADHAWQETIRVVMEGAVLSSVTKGAPVAAGPRANRI